MGDSIFACREHGHIFNYYKPLDEEDEVYREVQVNGEPYRILGIFKAGEDFILLRTLYDTEVRIVRFRGKWYVVNEQGYLNECSSFALGYGTKLACSSFTL